LRDPRNLPELTLQRRRAGRRHGLGAGALQRCTHGYGRKINLRQGRNRQERTATNPANAIAAINNEAAMGRRMKGSKYSWQILFTCSNADVTL
jgi:hypothetical protein